MTPTILKSTQYGGKIFQGVESTVMVKKVDPRLRDPASERPIIGLTDNRLYRQANNSSVSADRHFHLSAIDPINPDLGDKYCFGQYLLISAPIWQYGTQKSPRLVINVVQIQVLLADSLDIGRLKVYRPIAAISVVYR